VISEGRVGAEYVVYAAVDPYGPFLEHDRITVTPGSQELVYSVQELRPRRFFRVTQRD